MAEWSKDQASIPLHEVAQVRILLGAYYWPIKGTSIRGCAYRVKFPGRSDFGRLFLLGACPGGGAVSTECTETLDFQVQL